MAALSNMLSNCSGNAGVAQRLRQAEQRGWARIDRLGTSDPECNINEIQYRIPSATSMKFNKKKNCTSTLLQSTCRLRKTVGVAQWLWQGVATEHVLDLSISANYWMGAHRWDGDMGSRLQHQ